MGKYANYMEKYLGVAKSDTKTQQQRNDAQIKNYATRLASKNVNPEEALDKRNFIEKALNLRQDQNALFDLFELINRPQQALFGGWKNAQEGGSFLEGAKEGLFGNTDTEFKDILMNTGAFEDEKGKLNLVDALGFAGDIFLDPADLVPVAGFGKIGKALDEGEDVYRAIKSADSLTDATFKTLGKGAKKALGIADTGIEKGLKYLDATKGVKAYDKMGNVLSDKALIEYGNAINKRATEMLPEVINKNQLGRKLFKTDKGRLQSYRAFKNGFEDMFKKSQSSINAILNKRAAENTASEVRAKLGTKLKQNENLVRAYAEDIVNNSGGAIKIEDAMHQAGEDLSLYLESLMDRSIEKDELLDIARSGKLPNNKTGNEIMNAFDEMRNQIPESIRNSADFSVKVNDKGYIQLGDGWKKDYLSGNGIKSFKELDPDHSIIADYGNLGYYDTDLERIDYLKENEKFKNLVNSLIGEIKEGDKIVFDGDKIKILSDYDAVQKHRQLLNDFRATSKGKGWNFQDETYANRYVGNQPYREINDALNAGNELVGSNKKTKEALDKGISLYPVPEDIGLTKFDKAYHARRAFGLPDLPTDMFGKMSPEDLEQTAKDLQPLIGKEFSVSKGFNSAAVGEGFSYFKQKDTLMNIRAQKGTPMYITNPQEREAILNRAQKYVLRNAKYTNINGVPKLVLDVDIFDKDGQKLATLSNDIANDYNKILDEAFGTGFSKMYGDNNSYLPHTLADSTMADAARDANVDTVLRGNTSLLSHRTRLGSMRENNNLWQEARDYAMANSPDEIKKFYNDYPKLFEEDFNKAMANKYYDGMTNLAKQHKIVNDTLIEQTFGTRNDIENLQAKIQHLTLEGDKEELAKVQKEYNDLIKNSSVKYLTKYDNNVPQGFTKLSNEQTKDIRNKLKAIRQATGADNEGYKTLLKAFDSTKGSIAVNDDVLRMLEVVINPKEKNALLKAYDKVLDLYKSTKTLSFTNALNNFVGNSSNLALSGINMTDQARLMPEAVKIMNNGKDLYLKQIAGEVLTDEEAKIAKHWKNFIDTGFGSEEIAYDLQDLPDFMKDIAKNGRTNKKINAKDVATWLPRINMRANSYVDNLNRLTVMLMAEESPAYLRKLGIEGANDIEKYRKAISKVMFDPTMMTDAERNVFKRIVPFYTYAKNNLVFQMDNLGKNGSRYNKLMKTIRSLQKGATDDNEENMAEYIKNNLYIPIPGIGENGDYTVLRAQLPFGDMLDLAQNPGEYFVNKTGPALKTPFELSTNKNTFTGLDIEKFPGEKSKQLPFLTKKQEKIFGDLTGLDVPLKTAIRTFSSNPLEAITMQNNINTDRLSKSYEQISDLQNLMKQYEQKGYEFSTMNELKRANYNSTIGDIDAILAKYGVGTSKNDLLESLRTK